KRSATRGRATAKPDSGNKSDAPVGEASRCSFPNQFGDPVVAFDKIDTDEGTAETPGFFCRREENVNVTLVGSNLHVLDIALDGGLTVVTVFAKEMHDGRVALNGRLRP